LAAIDYLLWNRKVENELQAVVQAKVQIMIQQRRVDH
jgi:hypothetical protein